MPYELGSNIGFRAAIARGLKRRCPHCGEGRAFTGYLQLTEHCAACGERLGHIRADDFPPYLTIFVVGHIVVPLALFAEQAYGWSTELHMAIWLPLSMALLLAVLPVMKGAAVGLMWRLGMTGSEQH